MTSSQWASSPVDDETATALALRLGAAGHVRPTTMRTYGSAEMADLRQRRDEGHPCPRRSEAPGGSMRHRLTPHPIVRPSFRAEVVQDETDLSGSLLGVLKRWRDRLYRRQRFSTFSDRELEAVANSVPTDATALKAALHSETKAERDTTELLDLIARKLARDRIASGGTAHG